MRRLVWSGGFAPRRAVCGLGGGLWLRSTPGEWALRANKSSDAVDYISRTQESGSSMSAGSGSHGSMYATASRRVLAEALRHTQRARCSEKKPTPSRSLRTLKNADGVGGYHPVLSRCDIRSRSAQSWPCAGPKRGNLCATRPRRPLWQYVQRRQNADGGSCYISKWKSDSRVRRPGR